MKTAFSEFQQRQTKPALRPNDVIFNIRIPNPPINSSRHEARVGVLGPGFSLQSETHSRYGSRAKDSGFASRESVSDTINNGLLGL